MYFVTFPISFFFVVYVVDGEDEEMCTCATRKQITDGSMVPDKCCGVSTMPECAIRNGKMNYYYYTYGYSRLNEMLSKCWKAEFFQLWWMLSLMSFALFMRAVDIITLQYSPKFQCCGQFVVRAQWFSLKMVHNGCASHIMRFEFHITRQPNITASNWLCLESVAICDFRAAKKAKRINKITNWINFLHILGCVARLKS